MHVILTTTLQHNGSDSSVILIKRSYMISKQNGRVITFVALIRLKQRIDIVVWTRKFRNF